MGRERRDQNDSGLDSLADATGMERPGDLPAMEGRAQEQTDEPTGDERTAVEAASANAASERAFGGGVLTSSGGIGSDVPTDEEEGEENSDPRGY